MSSNAESLPQRGPALRFQLATRSQVMSEPPRDLSAYVEVFHEWIRREVLGHLIIDVVSYEHLPSGPGVLLIGHETDYAIRCVGGRVELTCRHKRASCDAADVLSQTLRRLVEATELLERADAVHFDLDYFEFRSNDRLRLANRPEALPELKLALGAAFREVFGAGDLDLSLLSRDNEPLTVGLVLVLEVA